MPSFWRHVNTVIQKSELIIEVLDSRNVEDSRNLEIEAKVNNAGKKLLFVINKCDLVNVTELEKYKKKLNPIVFISSKDKLGTTILKKKILEISRGKEIIVGVLGYPNVGKSSLINALSGRGAARTSSRSGYTRGLQKVKVDNKIMVLDTPGVLPYREKDETKHAKMSAIDYSQVKDPEYVALNFIEENKDLVKNHYKLKKTENDELLEELAFRLGRLVKGGKPDLESTSRALLKDWQKGKIK
jgi:small GTP-binding protein